VNLKNSKIRKIRILNLRTPPNVKFCIAYSCCCGCWWWWWCWRRQPDLERLLFYHNNQSRSLQSVNSVLLLLQKVKAQGEWAIQSVDTRNGSIKKV